MAEYIEGDDSTISDSCNQRTKEIIITVRWIGMNEEASHER